MYKLRDFEVTGKKIIVRCDFNVPIEKGRVMDNFRIKNSLETLRYLRRKKAKVIIISHLGRPQEIKSLAERRKKFSLRPISVALSKSLKTKVAFVDDCLGRKVKEKIAKMKNGDFLLLENLRFYEGEENNSKKFAESLAKLGDIYINEAFSVAHRKHASVVALPEMMPSGIGFGMEKEMNFLSMVSKNPKRPFVIIIGGAKISSKLEFIKKFYEMADVLMFGGKIANIILQIAGIYHDKQLKADKKTIKTVKQLNLKSRKIKMPIDVVVASSLLPKAKVYNIALEKLSPEEEIYDIGAKTIKIFSQELRKAKTIFWAGPVGFYENKKFSQGTKKLALAVSTNKKAVKVIGGGDTIAAFKKFKFLNKVDYASTGGGAMLAFLSGKTLPAIKALEKAAKNKIN